MEIARRPDWRPMLAAYLSGIAHRPFRPGSHDCALFAAGAVRAMTGADLAADWLGYKTLAQGRAVLQQAGFADQVALAERHFPAIAPAYAGPGDLGILDEAGERILGVVQGARVYVLRPSGLGLVSLLNLSGALRV